LEQVKQRLEEATTTFLRGLGAALNGRPTHTPRERRLSLTTTAVKEAQVYYARDDLEERLEVQPYLSVTRPVTWAVHDCALVPVQLASFDDDHVRRSLSLSPPGARTHALTMHGNRM
jgi:hypothetical protein